MSSTLEILLGAVLSILTTVVIEALKRPRLKILETKKITREYPQYPENSRKASFIYGHVINKPLPKILRFIGRDVAIQCRGKINFYNQDGSSALGSPMHIRWVNSPEPQLIIVQQKDGKAFGKFSENLHDLQFIDIAPGVTEGFDIVVKINDEPEIYGWSNETYIWSFQNEPSKKWRKPDHKLENTSYFVEVQIYNATAKASKFFVLHNPTDPEGFRISSVSNKDKRKLRKLINKYPITEQTGD